MTALPPVSFDRIAETYDATRVFPADQQERIARGILAAIGGRLPLRIVEPGVGTGRIALPLLRQGVTYAGTDISPLMLDQMRRKLQAEPWLAGRATLAEADAESLPFEDASFDAALTAHLLHLVPDWRRVLDEMRRVVRPGGCYVHACDNTGQAHAIFSQTWKGFAQARGLDRGSTAPASELDILNHLGLSTDAITQFELARWARPTTVAEMLRTFRERQYSHQWHLDDHDHAVLMAELEAWAVAGFGSPDRVLPSEASFMISVIRLPA